MMLIQKVLRWFKIVAVSTMLFLSFLYGGLYACLTHAEPVQAGAKVYISCGYGAPLEASARTVTSAGTCRVFKSYVDMAFFYVAFQIESLFRENLFMRIEAY